MVGQELLVDDSFGPRTQGKPDGGLGTPHPSDMSLINMGSRSGPGLAQQTRPEQLSLQQVALAGGCARPKPQESQGCG